MLVKVLVLILVPQLKRLFNQVSIVSEKNIPFRIKVSEVKCGRYKVGTKPLSWDLRKAGLGVLTNMKGDHKPVSLIEDTAVNVDQMPGYIDDFEKMLAVYDKEVVYHAHIGTG